MRLLAVVLLVFAAFNLTGAAEAQRRLALVIGIDRYSEVPSLEKAVGDAHAMAGTLQQLGFSVTEVIDPDRRALNQALAAFAATISPGDVVLVHFSGHGVEIDGENYLLPSDAPKPSSGQEDFVKSEAIAMSGLVARLADAGASARIFVIDACRDNPFEQMGVRSVGATRGLARVEAPAGTFIMYSAGYKQTALDSLGPSDGEPTSVYTRALLKHLSTPGKALDDVAQDVRQEVEALAQSVGHAQRPAYYDELSGRVVLATGDAAPAEPAPADAASSLPTPPADAIATDYLLAERIGTTTAWDAFLEKYGADSGNFYVELAEAARQKLVMLEPDAEGESTPQAGCEGGLVASVGKAGVAEAAERCLKPGDTFIECDECPEMVVVPAGRFTMGSPRDEKGRGDDEGPQHDVTIATPFAAGRFEVTSAEFGAFVSDTGYVALARCWTFENAAWELRDDRSWRNPGFAANDSAPVVCMSPDDAMAYVAWLAGKTGEDYRLLTEAEWEYAARAGSTTTFFFGDGGSEVCEHMNLADSSAPFDWRINACDDGVGDKPARVGTYRPNPFGLYDVHGNVWEWVRDCYHIDFVGAPTDGSAWTDGGSCQRIVIKGGSWCHDLEAQRPANREGGPPDNRGSCNGFRVARTLIPGDS